MEVFGKKTIQDLQEELYDNHVGNKSQIKALIDSLAPLIRDAADASVLVPLLSQYLGMYIKNDELLLKLIQSLTKPGSTAFGANDAVIPLLSADEKKELLANFEQSKAKVV